MTTIGARYEAYCNRTALNGSNEKFKVLPDSWRNKAMAAKTQQEYQAVHKDYQKGFIEFGKSYVEHIDKKYGNGDRVLTKDEYVKSELAAVPDDMKEYNIYYIQMAENTFENMNVDKTKYNNKQAIDAKEMAAVLSMFDADSQALIEAMETEETCQVPTDGILTPTDIGFQTEFLTLEPEASDSQITRKNVQNYYLNLFNKLPNSEE